jgi:DNA-binding response OmpR family regulator
MSAPIPALQTLPFIMITNEAKQEKLNAAMRAGVTSCIVKPFNAATLAGKARHRLRTDGHLSRSPARSG